MLPDDWMPHRRDDGELVGYIAMTADAFTPFDVLGRPLAEPSDWFEAEAAVDAAGLAFLAEPWELDTAEGPQRVRIIELSPQSIRVKQDDMGAIEPGRQPQTWEVPLPLDDDARLRPATAHTPPPLWA